MASLYERIGGQTTVMAAVDLFYKKILGDPVTKPFFDGVDMGTQVMKQIAFMTVAFGGPVEYRGRDMRAAHTKLVRDKGLGDTHFDAVVQHLEDTLRELDIDDSLIQEVRGVLEGTRKEVLDG